MESTSLWQTDAEAPFFGKLTGSHKVDVLVVGGGITGITTAHLLKASGCRVALVERRQVGSGETAHTTAHVTYVTDTRLSEMVSKVGRSEAHALWDAGEMAMNQIQAIATNLGIECGLRRVPGYLYAGEGKDLGSERKTLQRDAEWAAQMGFDAVYLESAPVFHRPAVRFANQLKFHSLKYLFGMAQNLPSEQCLVFGETDGTQLDEEKQELHTADGAIHYDSLVVATHVPIQGRRGTLSAALFQTKLAAYSTYAIEASIGAVPESLFWDTNDPYLYLRFDGEDSDSTRVIIGGEDHKTGQESETESRYASLQRVLWRTFPEAKPVRRWSGQVIETPDGLPFIGETGNRQFLATGFAGNGMTLGTFSAMLISDLICGKTSPWTNLFDPHRKRLAGAWQYLRENKDFPACFVKDRLFSVHRSASEVGLGHGALALVDGKKCAVYVDEKGKQFVLSPVCPHMGCIVGWNEAEKTWDCPCHGSRFTFMGDLIAGPAEIGLEKIGEEIAAQ